MSTPEITAIAWKLLQAKRSIEVLSTEERRLFARNPEVRFLVETLQTRPTGSWDRVVLGALTPGRAVVTLTDVFSPVREVPPALFKIYNVIENQGGALVSYNYDGIHERQSRFRVIAPHGRRPDLLLDPLYGPEVRAVATEFRIDIPTDWYLPVPETDLVRSRPAYQDMLAAWACAHTIIFVGYAFGRGADSISFEDFGRTANRRARIHVLCPPPDSADLCRQVGYAVRGRGRDFRVFGHPFRWRQFSEGVLRVVEKYGATHIREAIGRESEIVLEHDRG